MPNFPTQASQTTKKDPNLHTRAGADPRPVIYCSHPVAAAPYPEVSSTCHLCLLPSCHSPPWPSSCPYMPDTAHFPARKAPTPATVRHVHSPPASPADLIPPTRRCFRFVSQCPPASLRPPPSEPANPSATTPPLVPAATGRPRRCSAASAPRYVRRCGRAPYVRKPGASFRSGFPPSHVDSAQWAISRLKGDHPTLVMGSSP